MQFKDLYLKGLDRKVNPAVSASDVSEETINTEIEEYVFTKEIVINLFKILKNIKTNEGSHVGIWINGYYGSGKSHFLKYVSYCLLKEHAEKAMSRLINAYNDILKASSGLSDIDDVSMGELETLKKWYVEKADVELVLFNIGDVHDANANHEQTFTTIFWNQFNSRRGYNSFNLPMAQFLEKALDDDGKFDEFKQYVKGKGYDWEANISRFSAGRLDMALQMAKEVDSNLSIDAIKNKIINNDLNVSVDAFANEIKEYIQNKGNRNYRIMFFVDEVSQFIGEHRDLLLQLQSLVKRLEEVCESQAWIACTAQQTLDEVVTNVGGNSINPEDEVGKILGRFEVKASLSGTSPQYITQKRILEKNDNAKNELAKIFKADKNKLDAQFVLPSPYHTYKDAEDFASFYPFVPYQFQLIMKVLDSFVALNYVNKEVKGNERSLLNITYYIARDTRNQNVGEFISFDSFFGPMFQGSMQHIGQRALENARLVIEKIQNEDTQKFYRRVVYSLFMICNMADNDKRTFPATLDNIAVLLMTKIDENKASIKDAVQKVLDDLMDKSIIRENKNEDKTVSFDFYTEDESKVAEKIKNQKVDTNTYQEEMSKFIQEYFFTSTSNRESLYGRNFSIGANFDGKHFLSHNADIEVDFVTNSGVSSADEYAMLVSKPNHLVFYLCNDFSKDKEFLKNLNFYFRCQTYMKPENVIGDPRSKTNKIFSDIANEAKIKIQKTLQNILNVCPVISGQFVLSSSENEYNKGASRYKNLIQTHLKKYYPFSDLVKDDVFSKTVSELQQKIRRPIEAEVTAPLTDAEKKVQEYLQRCPSDPTVADVVRNFGNTPYGWADTATIYVINELVRRHLYAFSYNNNSEVSRDVVANNISREQNRFTIEPAKVISQDIINQFISAWKDIFNVVNVPGSNDSDELYHNCNDKSDSKLNSLQLKFQKISGEFSNYPFVKPIDEALQLMEKWRNIRDHKDFFVTITNDRASASQLFDTCKNINLFYENGNKALDAYKSFIAFLNTNTDNFRLLSNDKKSDLEALKAIIADTEPWKNIRNYNRLKLALENSLKERHEQLVADVTKAYNDAFDQLESFAKQAGVAFDKFANRQVTITRKTNTNNFDALQNNAYHANVMAFVDEQNNLINEEIHKRQEAEERARQAQAQQSNGQQNGNNNGNSQPEAPVVKVKPRKRVVVNTTQRTLKNEADVNAYLDELKRQIMSQLNDDYEFFI